MKIATYNVNSIRSRLPIVLDWLNENEPDVMALQETKVEDSKFPVADFEEAGWHVAIHGQKSYNGVAIVTRDPLMNVKKDFDDDPLWANDARIISGEINGVSIVNTYVPNGTAVGTDKWDYKLRWLMRFRQMISERYRPDQHVVWLGDINIAPTPNDVYNSPKFMGRVGHHPLEFKCLDLIGEWGWEDCFRKFTKGPGHYTYWDYVILTSVEKNFGWRIDHIYGSPAMAELCTECVIDRGPRSLEKPSDHTVVWAEFDL